MRRDEFENKRKSLLERIEKTITDAKKNHINNVEIFSVYGQGSSVEIEKNDIQTFESNEETLYGIRVIENGCEGFLTTNSSTDLLESVQEAYFLAKSQTTPDPCVTLPPAPKNPTPPIDELKAPLFDYEPNKVLEIAKNILSIREMEFPKVSLDSSGVQLDYSIKAVGSSNGILRSEASAHLSASFMGMAIDGSDIGSFDSESCIGNTPQDFHIHFHEKYYKFLNSCMAGLGAITIPSFRGYLYLPPESIFSFLIGGLVSSLSATRIRLKNSKMEGMLNKKVAHDSLTIYSNPTDTKKISATSFDREGQNTQNIPVVEKGILKNYFYNHYEACKAGLESSNGFASGGSGSTPGCGPKSLDIGEGKDSLTSMLNPNGKSIWVNRFSGSQSGVSGDFSGVIKGGFLMEKGEKIPVKEIQIAGNFYDILTNQISAISKEREFLGKSTWAPSILIDGISITGKN